MTVFIVSLFIPHTVHFDVNDADSPAAAVPRSSSQIMLGNYRRPTIDPFTPSSALPTPPVTSATQNPQGFFLDGSQPTQDSESKPARPSMVSRLPSVAGNETHSPAWGRKSHFTQPKSRAVSPPPQSIFKHARSGRESENGAVHGASLEDIREDSRDRALQSADWIIQPAEQGNGGLRNAVNAALTSGTLGHRIWVGTLGMPTDALGEERRRDIAEKLDHEYDCLAVYPSDSDFDGHYSHFCKTILWPVFHYQIPDSPRSKAYLDHSWAYYEKLNQLFANRIIKAWKRGDVIWIHDYHLLLVPSMVREKLPDAQIGFFLHTAFPSSEVFRCLAKRTKLLEGLLGANLIGFQTLEYCHHFLQTCNRLLCVEATPHGVQLEDRFVDVATFPIGIDPTSLDERRREADVVENLRLIRAPFAGKRLIVARDKMDTIRGVCQKLLAYETFLNKNPEFRENVVLIQVATPTVEQAELDAKVSDIVTRINSKHSTLTHQPLVFLRQDIDYSKYLALLMAADALMITSLREGMNLTSHEFVLCQDGGIGGNKHGCLILSEFTGSASLFAGDEISVNPWDSCQCAEAIRRALIMKPCEKEEKWQRLLARVQQHTADQWLNRFLAQLHRAWDQHSRQDTVSIPRLNVEELCGKYRNAARRLFLLDYEGTTIPKNAVPSNPVANLKRTIDALCNLTKDPRNTVYVLSERRPEDLDNTLRSVPSLGLVAENGGYVKEANSLKWHATVDVEAMQAWKQSIQGILEYYRERVAGSSVEERRCSILFHLEDERQAGECANQINDACRSQNVHAVPFDGGIVIESRDCDKGSATAHVFKNLTQNPGRDEEKRNGVPNGDASRVPEFLLVIGDAREDEAVYRWANTLGEDGVVRDVATVSVSSRNTAAQATLTQGVTGVLATLNKLASSDAV